ncbi:hypothetical protein OG535_36595 [Kitasatospora sp. NBC_00085]|uniref:hypothetical protein n=1 Tax=unclassified Kitasatospora TaxID=2633591 RepID=UPI003243FF23
MLALSLPAVAVAAPGDLDAGFGAGGKVTTDFGGVEFGHALALQSDGRIVARRLHRHRSAARSHP